MRVIRFIGTLGLAVLFATTAAFSWAPGTHAYVVSKMPGAADVSRPDLMFGAIAPDVNQMLSSDQNSPFFFATHYGFMDVWAAQDGTNVQRTLAFGFVTHNELWGADHSAHIQSFLYPKYVNPYQSVYPGQNGFVWKKAGEVCATLKSQVGSNPLAAMMLDGPKGLMNCHFIVEYGMDLVLKRIRDPHIGQELVDAALQHDSTNMLWLYTHGYPDLAPYFSMPIPQLGGFTAPEAWAYTMYLYGSALSRPVGFDTGDDVDAVADFLVVLAAQLLASDLEAAGVDASALKPLILYGLIDSMALCTRDYPLELDATIINLRPTLARHKVMLQ